MLHSSASVCHHAARIGDALDGAHREWFSHLLYVPLRNSAALVGEAAMPKRLEALGAEMAQQHEAPFDYAAEVAHYAAHGGAPGATDAAPWRAELHGDNATAGVVADTSAGLLPRYGVVVRTGAGPVGHQFAQFVHANPQLSVKELRASPEYRVARAYSQRNAQRLAAAVAGAMLDDTSYPVGTVCDARPDHLAAVGADAAVSATAPLLATPAAHTRFNDFAEAPRLADWRDALYVGARATTAPGSALLLRHRDHLKGFALTPGCATLTPERAAAAPPVWDVAQHPVVDSNPVFVGALRTKDSAAQWRGVLRRVYKDSATGEPINPATATALWRTSEAQAPPAGTTTLTPVALFLGGHAAPRTPLLHE